ncbi:MAG: hypothetical protein ACFHU9_03115 [Fluviicola sp.]
MKQLFFVLSFIVLIPLASEAQNDTVFVKYMDAFGDGESYHHDTLFASMPTENHILVGTTMLPNTRNQFSAYSFDLHFSGFAGSECKNHTESKAYGPDKVVDVQWTDSTLIINCQIGANCCHDFLGDIFVNDEGVLDLKYYGYGVYCACNCCFGLTYTFTIEHLSRDEKNELTAITINGNEDSYYHLK